MSFGGKHSSACTMPYGTITMKSTSCSKPQYLEHWDSVSRPFSCLESSVLLATISRWLRTSPPGNLNFGRIPFKHHSQTRMGFPTGSMSTWNTMNPPLSKKEKLPLNYHSPSSWFPWPVCASEFLNLGERVCI